MPAESSGNRATRFWQWMKGQFLQTVPEDVEICEYDCRKRQCLVGEWEKCDRRVRRAAGELMPDRAPQTGLPEPPKKPAGTDSESVMNQG